MNIIVCNYSLSGDLLIGSKLQGLTQTRALHSKTRVLAAGQARQLSIGWELPVLLASFSLTNFLGRRSSLFTFNIGLVLKSQKSGNFALH